MLRLQGGREEAEIELDRISLVARSDHFLVKLAIY